MRMRPIRALGYAVLGGTGVLASQMVWVRKSFKLPPDACGPTRGVCAVSGSQVPSSQAPDVVRVGLDPCL